MARGHHFDVGLQKNAANYTPLTPLSLLARTAYVYPQRPAVIHGERTLNWSEVYERCRRLASALTKHSMAKEEAMRKCLKLAAAVDRGRYAHFIVLF